MSKRIAPVIDIFPQLVASEALTPDSVRQQVRELVHLHPFRRIYCVTSNPGYPMFSSPWNALLPAQNRVRNHSLANILRLGDANFLFAREIKRQGAEAFAVFKPYELGGGRSVAIGAPTAPYEVGVEDVGGVQTGYDNLLSAHPEYAVARFPYDQTNEQQPIVRIELAFLLDPLGQARSRLARDEFPRYDDHLVAETSRYALYESDDNGAFRRLPVEPRISKRIELRVPQDANGTALADAPARFLVVELTGFSLTARFLAVVQEVGERLRIILKSMIRAHCEAGEVPCTVTSYVRHSACAEGEAHVWGNERDPRVEQELARAHDFERCGFEFDWHGAGFFGDGWLQSAVFCLARGKRRYMKGTPCEGHPEVRAYWLEIIDTLLDMGYDGIDIRLQNHSGMVCDWTHYGWNEPLRERYQAMFGRPLDPEHVDPMDVMRVRGAFYMDFLREAAARIHARGKKLQLHLRNAWEQPLPDHAFNQLAFWAMPKILPDWREAVDLADEITLKDYHHNHYEAGWSQGVKARCLRQGKPLWIHLYMEQGGELNEAFVRDVFADEGVQGVLLYEVTDQYELHGAQPEHARGGLIYMHDGQAHPNRILAAQLRDLTRQFDFGS